jgi:glutathione peroxidase
MSSFIFLNTTGKLISLEGFPIDTLVLQGKVLLIVNVASRCGLTPQYSSLVELQSRYAAQGFSVVGVPCNQFGKQEPGTAEQIRQFCSLNFGVDFPLLAKQDVNGQTRSPLYQFLVGDGADIQWNFEKFLLSKTGDVLGRFSPSLTPDDPQIITAVEAALS